MSFSIQFASEENLCTIL
jgi:hypothetical protein